MTIEAALRAMGQWSVWWVPVLLVVGSAVLWVVRTYPEMLGYFLLKRSVRRRIQRLERDRNGWLERGAIDKAAWLEWQRYSLWSESLAALPHNFREVMEALDRRVQALVDADFLASDRKSLEYIKGALADKSVLDELVNKKYHFDWDFLADQDGNGESLGSLADHDENDGHSAA